MLIFPILQHFWIHSIFEVDYFMEKIIGNIFCILKRFNAISSWLCWIAWTWSHTWSPYQERGFSEKAWNMNLQSVMLQGNGAAHFLLESRAVACYWTEGWTEHQDKHATSEQLNFIESERTWKESWKLAYKVYLRCQASLISLLSLLHQQPQARFVYNFHLFTHKLPLRSGVNISL